jgi:hypothetical protein
MPGLVPGIPFDGGLLWMAGRPGRGMAHEMLPSMPLAPACH